MAEHTVPDRIQFAASYEALAGQNESCSCFGFLDLSQPTIVAKPRHRFL